MAAYHQMGHDSRNLLKDKNLGGFSGAILSPVNETPDEMKTTIAQRADVPGFEFVFDPQYYEPRSRRSSLPEWPHFFTDTNTADESSPAWWQKVVDHVVSAAQDLGVGAVCSPVQLPKVPSDAHLAHSVDMGKLLKTKLAGTKIEPIQTAIVSLADLSQKGRALSIASTLSATTCDRICLVFESTTAQRSELSNADELKGAMRLIRELQKVELRVLVSNCSSDVVLWKFAGAESCASGKFMNIRRFTASRFGPEAEGFGNAAYWFEENLLAFIRQGDFLRVQAEGMLSASSQSNPLFASISKKMTSGKPWLADSWRQYLHWFADFQARYDAGAVDVAAMIATAQKNWAHLKSKNIFMEEKKNKGEWLAAWGETVKGYETF